MVGFCSAGAEYFEVWRFKARVFQGVFRVFHQQSYRKFSKPPNQMLRTPQNLLKGKGFSLKYETRHSPMVLGYTGLSMVVLDYPGGTPGLASG